MNEKRPIRDLIQKALCERVDGPAREIFQLLLRVSAELGPGNDGMLHAYMKEANAALTDLLQETPGRQSSDTETISKSEVRRAVSRLMEQYQAKHREAQDMMEHVPDDVQKTQWYTVMTYWGAQWQGAFSVAEQLAIAVSQGSGPEKVKPKRRHEGFDGLLSVMAGANHYEVNMIYDRKLWFLMSSHDPQEVKEWLGSDATRLTTVLPRLEEEESSAGISIKPSYQVPLWVVHWEKVKDLDALKDRDKYYPGR